jgi:uncharacterized membrane protein
MMKKQLMIVALILSTMLAINPACDARGVDDPGGRPVLMISDTPEVREFNYYQGIAGSMFILEHYWSPKTFLTDTWQVERVGFLDAADALEHVDRYCALIIWDAPARIRDTRDSDPHYRDVTIISDEAAARIERFVRDGGVLIMAGGVTCFGDGIERLGSAQPNSPNTRWYEGYADSPLAKILPVTFEDGPTLTAIAQPDLRRVGDEGVMDGLNIGDWPFRAYHKVTARPKAAVWVETADGDPMVAMHKVGKGAVIAVMPSPRGNLLVEGGSDSPSPIWADEPVFWERLLRAGLDVPLLKADDEAALRRQAAQLTEPRPRLPQSWRQREMPYLTHALHAALPSQIDELWLRFFRDQHFNGLVVQSAPLTSPDFVQRFDGLLERQGMWAMAHSDLAGEMKHTLEPEQYAQITRPGGEFALWYGDPSPDPWCPAVRELSCEKMDRIMQTMRDAPNWRGAVVDDEWAWTMGYRNPYQGHQGIASFSPWANEHYEQVTGKSPPEPVYREPGYVAPADDPFIKWCEIVRQDAFGDYNEAVRQVAHRYRPDFLLSNYPGGFEGNLDMMIEELYLDCWKESELEALERIDVRANLREDQTRTKHPIWGLVGIFRMPEDKSMYPETLRLTVGVALGGGAKGLILWNAANLWTPNMQHPGRDPLWVEARRLGDYLQRFGPMLRRLEKTPANVWCLSGWFWVNSFDAYLHLPPEGKPVHPDMERPWWMFQVSDIITPALMRSGMYGEFVTEKQLLSGELDRVKAVFLPGLIYCRQDVVDRLEQYIAEGGRIYVDESAKVEINGAERLPIDLAQWHRDIQAGKRPIAQPTEANYRKHRAQREAYVNQAIEVLAPLARETEPRIRIDSTEAAKTWLRHGRADYLFIFNSNVDQDRRFNVTFREAPGAVYDIAEGRRAPIDQDQDMAVDLPAGGWKVFAILDEPIQSVTIDQVDLSHDGQLAIALSVHSSSGTVDAAVPIRLVIRGSNDTIELFDATAGGKLELHLPLAMGIGDIEGIDVEELFSDHEQQWGR